MHILENIAESLKDKISCLYFNFLSYAMEMIHSEKEKQTMIKYI